MADMQVPLALLKQWLPLSESPQQIAEALTSLGLEVDAIDNDILSVSLTPNLSHCFSIRGIAHELSAYYNRPLTSVPIPEVPSQFTSPIQVTVEAGCTRYMAMVIEGVKVGPSPQWLEKAVVDLGYRSINNVVDAANYTMAMLGQPLHTFDKPSSIQVRLAKKGERFQESVLDEEMIVVADGAPIAIAGIKGAPVTETTTTILLESAHFDPRLVRRASKKLRLSTESSKRFERGHDPHLCPQGLHYAAALIGGRASQVIDIHQTLPQARTLTLRPERVCSLIGVALSINEIETLLTRLGFGITKESEKLLHVLVPTWRLDVTAEIDLVEEVARLYGLHNLPQTQERFRLSSLPTAPLFELKQLVQTRALRLGLQELLTSDLIAPPDEGIAVLNASCVEQSVLRSTLLTGLLETLKHNVDHRLFTLHGFEIGHTHAVIDGQFVEEAKIGILLSGQRLPAHWSVKNGELDFFDMKGLVEELLVDFAPVEWKPCHLAPLHPHQQVRSTLGVFGQVHPSLTPQPAFFAEISLHALLNAPRASLQYQRFSPFPAIERDFTVTVAESTPFEALLAEAADPLLEKVLLQDIYRSDSLGHGLKNMTLRLIFRSKAHTLKAEEAEKPFQAICQRIGTRYAVQKN